MSNKLSRPTWYDEKFYDKQRTPEEWLYELFKRDSFNMEKMGLPHSMRLLPIEQQCDLFLKHVFANESKKMIDRIEPIPPKPICYPPVSDIFRMYNLITSSEWYKLHPQRDQFENAMNSIANKHDLTKEQKIAFLEMYDTPWCAFHENHQQENWYPNQEWTHLSGIPLSLDPSYSKEDTVKVLKKKLTGWVGKLQDISLHFPTWQESNILAVFDLRVWFRMQRIEYTNINLHKLIWPKGRISKLTRMEVNEYDDIDYCIHLSERVINENVIRSLLLMCQARKYKREIINS